MSLGIPKLLSLISRPLYAYSMFENDLWKNAKVKALTESVNGSNRIKRVTRMCSYVANFICKHELRNAKFVRLIEWFIKNIFNVTEIDPRSTDKKVLGMFDYVQEIISCCIWNVKKYTIHRPGARLLAWINFNPSMDKYLHPS